MKILKVALILSVLLTINQGIGQDSDYDLEKIDTVQGRRYLNIRILGSDEHGLMFRHADGAAKVSFMELSMNLREMFEPLPEEEDPFHGGGEATKAQPLADEDEILLLEEEVVPAPNDGRIPAPPVKSSPKKKTTKLPDDFAIDIVMRNRVTIPLQNHRGYGACDPCARPIHWPSHWARHHPAHRLTDPCFRELAVRDFLYTTGLLPLPPGVSVTRLPTATPWNFR